MERDLPTLLIPQYGHFSYDCARLEKIKPAMYGYKNNGVLWGIPERLYFISISATIFRGSKMNVIGINAVKTLTP